jgi:hypothetical protein
MPTPSAATLSVFSSTANGSSYTFSTTLPAANRLVLANFEHHGTVLRSITSVVGGGAQNGWTSVISVTFNTVASPLDRLECWRSLSAAPTSSSVVTVTTSGTVSNLQGILTEFSNVTTTGTNGADAVKQSLSSNADAVSVLTVTLASFNSTVNVPYGQFAIDLTSLGITPGGDYKELMETTAAEHSTTQSEWTSFNTQKVVATWAAHDAAAIGIEVAGDNAAAAGGGQHYYHHYYSRVVTGVAA